MKNIIKIEKGNKDVQTAPTLAKIRKELGQWRTGWKTTYDSNHGRGAVLKPV